MELDLRSPGGLDAAAALVADSDVVVENWRPGRVDHQELGRLSVPGGPWRIDGEPVSARLPPPALGQHTAEILGGLGLGGALPSPEAPR